MDPQTKMAEEANAVALAALAAQGPGRLAAFAPAHGRMTPCPHCQQGFGSASLQIHVRRCRALLPDPEAEAAAAEAAAAAAKAAKALKKRQVPKLVDLCLRFITRNFQAVCIDKVLAAPEHEAALIESLPTDLVHRIITNLVFENKQIADKEDKQRAKGRQLKRELEDVKAQRGQLESFRHQAAMFRSRLNEQEQILETMRRDMEAMRHELTNAQQLSVQLQAQSSGFQKIQLRLEGRINALTAENDKLKAEVRNARKKEMDAFKRLASASKTGLTGKAATALTSHHSTGKENVPNSRPNKRPATGSPEKCFVPPRPHAEGSKIPFPSRLPAAYAAKCITQAE